MKILLTALMFILTSSYSHAMYERSEQLLWACNSEPSSPKEALAQFHCLGYVAGIIDGMQLIFGIKPESRLFCTPKSGISVDQQIKIVTKYLEKNPESLHKGARMTVLIAYAKAFPCK